MAFNAKHAMQKNKNSSAYLTTLKTESTETNKKIIFCSNQLLCSIFETFSFNCEVKIITNTFKVLLFNACDIETSKGGSIGSTPVCSLRWPSSNPAWTN